MAVARPGRVLAVWGALVVAGVLLSGALLGSALTSEGDVTNNPESKQAQELIDARLPQRDAVDEVVIVRSEQVEVTDPAFQRRVGSLVEELRGDAGVEEVASYLDPGGEALVSADSHAAMLPVILGGEEEERIDDVVGVVERADGADGFTVDITGEFTAGRDFQEVSGEDLSKGELQFGLPAAIIVLLLVFGTLVGAAIPLAMALISIIVGLGLVAVIGQFVELNLFIVNMLVAMGLALGIDYSLFIVSRLREERAKGIAQGEAILNVASTATRAVVFSGTAFALAMVGLFLVPDTVMRSLALGAIVVALVSIVVALTFHPALLMVLGDRVDRLRLPWLGERVAASAGREGRFWGAVVRAVMRHPTVSLVASVALLLATAPLLGLKLGAAGPSSLPDDTRAKQGLVALERDFPAGATEPVEIVADNRGGSPLDAQVEQLLGRLGSDPDFAADRATVEEGQDLIIISVPLTAEASSEDASAAIDRLRDEHVPASFGDDSNRVLVGGVPAEVRDNFAMLATWLPVVITFVLALSFVLLTLAFRSIVVPLTAIAVNLLSVGAAYGLLVLAFQEGFGVDLLGFSQVERIESWVPLFLFSVLFGLSMDYQVFLLSRIHERHSATGDTTDAIVFGVGSTGRLITGAALIIIAVFAGLAAGELVAFQQMGFGVAIALLVDATIVRLVVMPAAMRLLGATTGTCPPGSSGCRGSRSRTRSRQNAGSRPLEASPRLRRPCDALARGAAFSVSHRATAGAR
ncbi:MAG TPA: MMPL family transporter [Miltoncostaeaceae bacterium]|mgnify:CR=1 FL=1|nr:MMPL family transporter [Miltoncostaeaceae bacterium]